jgi:RNA polymerase sigma factor (sigma-70 family)
VKRIPTRQWLAENQRVTRLCNKLMRSFPGDGREDVRDAVQDAFLAFHKRKRQVDDWESYLRKISIRLIARALAKRRHRANLHALLEDLEQLAGPPTADPALQLQQEEHRKLISAAISNLTPRLRATLQLDMEGLSDGEIAQRLGIGLEAVRKNLHRGRAMVRAAILSPEDEHGNE